MLKWSKLKSQPLAQFCKGLILSARIYADTAGYKCPCGGVFNKRIEHSDHEKLMVPKCDRCNKYPLVFHIDADGEKSNMSYDIIPRSRDILNKYRKADRLRNLDSERDWIFKGKALNHVQDEALSDSWRLARKEAGHTHQMYEIRHRCLTEFGKRVKGDIMKMQKFSGHTNANTLMDRYIRDDSDLSEYIH